MTWTKITVTGHANHVGTTPMPLRKDALAAAAGIISGVEQLGCQTPGAVSTVGRISVEPNNSGVIPGHGRLHRRFLPSGLGHARQL